ncbi:hypothetical protein BFJ68_g16323 [Fusarium oxysporum]|uniref:Uncharacterized protein n=1 Tax=Fusarium oxysporum TaxID=5507 RepID=A0A420PEJ1_FUSOX|nr:hypothetical protein BFJ68_g16323 [Fusarium oxysporum]
MRSWTSPLENRGFVLKIEEEHNSLVDTGIPAGSVEVNVISEDIRNVPTQ